VGTARQIQLAAAVRRSRRWVGHAGTGISRLRFRESVFFVILSSFFEQLFFRYPLSRMVKTLWLVQCRLKSALMWVPVQTMYGVDNQSRACKTFNVGKATFDLQKEQTLYFCSTCYLPLVLLLAD
jgi:hypothetical protein